jgi:hypothetical protein
MQEDNTAIRRHVRHVTGLPVDITLDYSSQTDEDTNDDTITNVSLGGMSFISDGPFDIDQRVRVRFPILNDKVTLNCRVIWCESTRRGYKIGIEFDKDDEVLRLRLIDQISEIEDYRQRKESIGGRPLSSEQAAREWVKRYAGDFSTQH